jgi:hypothetical protein
LRKPETPPKLKITFGEEWKKKEYFKCFWWGKAFPLAILPAATAPGPLVTLPALEKFWKSGKPGNRNCCGGNYFGIPEICIYKRYSLLLGAIIHA